jgi:hypothetical protein
LVFKKITLRRERSILSGICCSGKKMVQETTSKFPFEYLLGYFFKKKMRKSIDAYVHASILA